RVVLHEGRDHALPRIPHPHRVLEGRDPRPRGIHRQAVLERVSQEGDRAVHGHHGDAWHRSDGPHSGSIHPRRRPRRTQHDGVVVQRWDPEAVELRLPFNDEWSASDGYLHGGAVATLIDTAGCGAVAAGHDYVKGRRATTVSLSVQYLSFAQREDIVATAQCT